MADNALLKGLGGIMVGVGEGMVQQGKEKRALALEALRQNRLDARSQADREFRAAENEKNRESRSSMVKDTFTGKDGQSYVLTAGGETRPLGVTMGEDNKNDPANVREARWLVKNGVAPNLNKAYEMVRTRKTVDPTSMRQRALSWVASQKDRYGRPKYTEPEAQAAAVSAYEKWATGDSEGAVSALKSLEPKDEKKDETAWYESLWSSIGFGGGDGAATDKPSAPETETPEQAQGGAFSADGAGYDYARARQAGMSADGTGENAGHWGSVAPTTPEEQRRYGLPKDSYVILKGKAHKTFDKAVAAEQQRGFEVVKKGDRYFSVPKGGASSGDLPPAPRDKSQRKTGEIYKAPDGRKVKWMGNGWQLVK